MIERTVQAEIKARLFKGKAIIVLGSRQTGKTTLLRDIAEKHKPYLLLNCDEAIVRERLQDASKSELQRIVGNNKLVFIDEAQRVKNIGLVLKIITDQMSDVQLLVSGSSSFELTNEINEPLTGRKWEYQLYPISWNELSNDKGYLDSLSQLEHRLIYGMYPDVINHVGDEEEVLNQLSDSYLYKDLLAYKGIRKPDILEKLLRALALQVGSEVSYNELSRLLQIDKNTVSSYIELLEKVFVIFRLPAFSNNMRKEIRKPKKIYFYDNGIRNSIISNYQPFQLRTDKGALWENFLISERIKHLDYKRDRRNHFFWRTTDQQEIDLVEEKSGLIKGYEFKWSTSSKVRIPASFKKKYKAEVDVIHKDNFYDFVTFQGSGVK
ncbi:MAG: ATP-binding protein [Candidatus Woykebacteria bacterium]